MIFFPEKPKTQLKVLRLSFPRCLDVLNMNTERKKKKKKLIFNK